MRLAAVVARRTATAAGKRRPCGTAECDLSLRVNRLIAARLGRAGRSRAVRRSGWPACPVSLAGIHVRILDWIGSRPAIGAALASRHPDGRPRAGRAVEGESLMPDVSFTELPGRRVVVRRFRPQDVAEFVAYRSDAEVARYQSWDAPYPPEQGERFVAQMMTAHPDTPGEWFQFAVALRATGQLI